MKKRITGISALIFVWVVFSVAAALAAAPDYAFFNGKTVEIIVPHGPGGGFDTYARMFAPYFKKHIPGINVVINNVTGAGGLRGRNQLWASKPDGRTICLTTGSGMLFAQWSGIEGVKYDISKLTWVGRVAFEEHVMATSGTKPFKSLDDLKNAGRAITLGFSGVGSDDYFASLIMGKLLGLEIDPVTGYTGSREANLAAVKGEVDGVQVSVGSILPLFKSGDLKPIMVVGDTRSPEMPDVPTALELATSQEAKDIAKALSYSFEIDRVIFAPPGVPAERLAVLREAYQKTVNDPDFQKMLEKNKRTINYLGGEKLEKLVNDIFSTEGLLAPKVRELRKISK
ncbi:MAG: tripartite tricarboxylate transporter substrate binding protein [Desulfobacterales bacterium]|nr:tripartite tricarboxylate transporter substrate binding protein [Desulfobacterales bacterium]